MGPPAEPGDFALSARSAPGCRPPPCRTLGPHPELGAPSRGGGSGAGRGLPDALGPGAANLLSSLREQLRPAGALPLPGFLLLRGRPSVLLRPSPPLPAPLGPLPRPLPAQSTAGALGASPPAADRAHPPGATRINLGPRGLPSDLLSPGFQRPLHPLIFSQIPDKKA